VQDHFYCRTAKGIAIAVLLAGIASLPARAEEPRCDAQANAVRFANPLPHLGRKLSSRQPIVIVAIGSSSTAGVGASSPAATYPSRLELELRERFKRAQITVINRGVGGEEVPDMLKRFDQAVIANRPDLVIWQLGTNSVIRDHKVADHGALIRAGIERIRKIGADIVLLDPQFAPKVIAKPEAERMVQLIAVTAKNEDIDLFPRFNVMRHWHDAEHIDFKSFVSPDGLHMNDWSYACLAKNLSHAIAEAAMRPVVSASVHAFAD
jgi:lysophospholipase L1-like esterase